LIRSSSPATEILPSVPVRGEERTSVPLTLPGALAPGPLYPAVMPSWPSLVQGVVAVEGDAGRLAVAQGYGEVLGVFQEETALGVPELLHVTQFRVASPNVAGTGEIFAEGQSCIRNNVSFISSIRINISTIFQYSNTISAPDAGGVEVVNHGGFVVAGTGACTLLQRNAGVGSDRGRGEKGELAVSGGHGLVESQSVLLFLQFSWL